MGDFFHGILDILEGLFEKKLSIRMFWICLGAGAVTFLIVFGAIAIWG